MTSYKDILRDAKFDMRALNSARKRYNHGVGKNDIDSNDFIAMFLAGDVLPFSLKRKFILELFAKPTSKEEINETTPDQLLDFTIKILLKQLKEYQRGLSY